MKRNQNQVQEYLIWSCKEWSRAGPKRNLNPTDTSLMMVDNENKYGRIAVSESGKIQ